MEQINSMTNLPPQCRAALKRMIDGTDLPPLYSNVIAQRIFDAGQHPDRLGFLLRGITRDNTIDIRSASSAKIWRQPKNTNGSILLIQYTVTSDPSKNSQTSRTPDRPLLVVLMTRSPKPLRDFDQKSDKYIHRFTTMTSDTGLSYPSKSKLIYVQLDKCCAQFKKGINAESEDGRPDRLQKLLSMIADVNDSELAAAAAGDESLTGIRNEIRSMAQNRELLRMLAQEMIEHMDWNNCGGENARAAGSEGVRESEGAGAHGEAHGDERESAGAEAPGGERAEAHGEAHDGERESAGAGAPVEAHGDEHE